MNQTSVLPGFEYENKYDFNSVPLWKAGILYVLCPVLIIWRSYRLWQKVAIDYNYKVSPFWRSALMIIFNFPLFKIIEKHANAHGEKFAVSSTWLAVMYVASYICISLIGYENLIVDIICDLLIVFPFIYVQYKINVVNQKAYPNAYVEKWNIWDSIFALTGLIFKVIGIFFDRK